MNTKLLKKRLAKVRMAGYFLQAVPFIRAIILNGSMATGQIKESSDIDLLIVARDGRIFTVRFLANVLFALLGQKRSKDENKSHAGKFCFNYFMTVSYLNIPTGRGEEMDQYCAENYSNSVLVWGDSKVFEKFLVSNSKLFSQCHPNRRDLRTEFPITHDHIIESTGTSNSKSFGRSLPADGGARDDKRSGGRAYFPLKTTLLLLLGYLGKIVLTGQLGDRVEQILKRLQIKRIEDDPRTKRYPGLIVYNDRELRFHPSKRILDRHRQ